MKLYVHVLFVLLVITRGVLRAIFSKKNADVTLSKRLFSLPRWNIAKAQLHSRYFDVNLINKHGLLRLIRSSNKLSFKRVCQELVIKCNFINQRYIRTKHVYDSCGGTDHPGNTANLLNQNATSVKKWAT